MGLTGYGQPPAETNSPAVLGRTEDSQAVAGTALVVGVVPTSKPARHLRGWVWHITLCCGCYGKPGVAYMLVGGPPTADQCHVEPCQPTDQDQDRQDHHHQYTPDTCSQGQLEKI